MKIRVNFKPEDLPTLRKLAHVETNEEARLFVQGRAMDDVQMYLTDNGVRTTATERY